MGETELFRDRRKKVRSPAEVIIAIAAVIGVLVSIFTGIRAFYVNEYRIDVLEVTVKETRQDIKETKSTVQDLDRSVQRLIWTTDKRTTGK